MDNHMLFKRSSSLSKLAHQTHQTDYNKLQRQAKNSSKMSFCKVCGDKANIINYGALACQSCKTFFRRNCFHPETVRPCLFNGSCEMNKYSRRHCTACRVAKCFSMGMSSDLIRKEERKNTKIVTSTKITFNKRTARDQTKSVVYIRKYKPSYDDQPLLLSFEHKIVSNIMLALEIYSAIPNVRSIVEINLYFDVTNTMKIITLMYTSIRSFINSIPDFQVLTINEQYSLFKRNLNGITSLYSAVVFRDADIINNKLCLKSFASIYGSNMIIQLIRNSRKLDSDLTIVKFTLLILAFSSNCTIVDFHEEIHDDTLLFGTYRLLGSQNAYVEILWKYLILQYGYYSSALLFARLMTLFLDLNKSWTHAYMNNTIHRSLVNDFNRQTQESLIINQDKQVRLWGIA